MAERMIAVEVVYADAIGHVLRQLVLPDGSTLAQAIIASDILAGLPSAEPLDQHRQGIFGRRVTLDYVLRDGDRIEIYRPLEVDPMDARRRRARAI
jgi:putative ubiquitin-RnfH superfamily antitoxin RatB of RatAB toxin-antitoxin module